MALCIPAPIQRFERAQNQLICGYCREDITRRDYRNKICGRILVVKIMIRFINFV